MKQATIVGATGFGGIGLIEILLRHPGMEIRQLVARKDAGKPVSDIFPHLRGFCDLPVDPPEKIAFDGIDIAFLSTPDRAGMSMIGDFRERGVRVIDFSGDFRFTSERDYAAYAKNRGLDETHLAPDVLRESVYGLPEKYGGLIRNAGIVGNPGCFAICMILGILPAVEAGLAAPGVIICDGVTGVSGAGKNSGESNLYPQRHENANTYREGTHQHRVEVENVINEAGTGPYSVLFVPRLVPLNRGIIVVTYMDAATPDLDGDALQSAYRDYYRGSPFVAVTDRSPNTAEVRGSNRCLVRPIIDPRTGKVMVISAIDNLVKGQAGNAVQCANIMLGMEETAGLLIPAFYP